MPVAMGMMTTGAEAPVSVANVAEDACLHAEALGWQGLAYTAQHTVQDELDWRQSEMGIC